MGLSSTTRMCRRSSRGRLAMLLVGVLSPAGVAGVCVMEG